MSVKCSLRLASAWVCSAASEFVSCYQSSATIPVLPVLCYQSCATSPVLTTWGELSVECKIRLQRVQNRAARIIVRRDSTCEALKILGWSNLETIRKGNKSILVYKCLNNLIPQYLSDYFR